MTAGVEVEYAERIAIVRLMRPEKLNALNADMFMGLLSAGREISARRDIWAVVIAGNGRAFCSGIDMSRLGQSASDAQLPRMLTHRTHGIANLPQQVVLQWRQLAQPVIAAVHGVAFGADIRYIAPTTRLSIMEVEWGLAPDMGGTALMRKFARDDVIRELTFTGRVFSGEEALTYGFATRVCKTPLEMAITTAREIAEKSPHAVSAAKRLLNRDCPLADALLSESIEHDLLLHQPNQAEAVASRMAKRPARFLNPE